MLGNLDRRIGERADALTAAGLWGSTVLFFMSDNGGCVSLSENAANNWPLRGGKYHPLEGGSRVASMWSGGFLPAAARGSTTHGLVHIADYFMTICKLAGIAEAECRADPLAASAGLPPIESLDVWPLVTGLNSSSPRTEVPIDAGVLLQAVGGSSAGPWWKLFTSSSVAGAGWTGEVFPNSSSPDPEAETLHCQPGGCLFDVWADPAERQDVAAAHPDIVAAMGARLAELAPSFYSNSDAGGKDACPQGVAPDQCMCWAATHIHSGFIGPFHSWP